MKNRFNGFWPFTLLLSLSLHSTAQARISFEDVAAALGSLFPGFVSDQGSCPEPPKPIEGLTPEQIFTQGETLLRKERVTCEAARYFFEVMRQDGASSLHQKAQLKYIEALRLARDFNGAVNEANRYLDTDWRSPGAEEAHYQIVLAVRDQIGLPKHSQTWSEYALGIGPGQNESAPYLMNLAFQSFLDRFPNSRRKAEVSSYVLHARNSLAAHFLEVGLYYYKRKEYKAAIGRFMYIARNGRATTSFEPATYYAIMSFRAFARMVRSGEIKDKRLAELMGVAPGEKISRDEVAQKAEASARSLEQDMRRHLPDSEWTRKIN
jgi:outer membrane protein assembly factor BamD